MYDEEARKQPRWKPIKSATAGKVVKWIETLAPETIDFETDEYNGRWRVCSQDLNLKSISWTKRGWEAAACETLYWAWKFHTDESGEECPFNLKEFEKRFREEAELEEAEAA